jgi:hypothetical protein
MVSSFSLTGSRTQTVRQPSAHKSSPATPPLRAGKTVQRPKAAVAEVSSGNGHGSGTRGLRPEQVFPLDDDEELKKF